MGVASQAKTAPHCDLTERQPAAIAGLPQNRGHARSILRYYKARVAKLVKRDVYVCVGGTSRSGHPHRNSRQNMALPAMDTSKREDLSFRLHRGDQNEQYRLRANRLIPTPNCAASSKADLARRKKLEEIRAISLQHTHSARRCDQRVHD